MTSEIDRIRTDAIISIHRATDFDFVKFAEMLPDQGISSADTATLLGGMGPQLPEYKMQNLSEPMAVSQMKIPNHKEFLAGHTKVSHNPMTSWMSASLDSKYGQHHPFGMESNSCPLLHGSSWGDPAYAEHLIHAIEFLQDNMEHERRLTFDKKIYGDPKESQYDLYTRDRGRYRNFSDEEYLNGKKFEWQKKLGLLPYLFGLEYNTEEQREQFYDLLKQMGKKKSMYSPDSKFIQNKMQEKAGISWGRARRNWMARFTPILQWWSRASDRHGPVTPAKPSMGFMKSDDTITDMHYVSPYVIVEPTGIEKSHTYHWWDLFQPWGGVGRDHNSLHEMLKQSYPNIFDGGWLNESLFDLPLNILKSYDTDGGSHFPNYLNNPETEGHESKKHLSSKFNDVDFFEKRRANWSHSSNLHFLHPSEIKGQGGRMIVPSDQMMLSRLGRSLASQADLGAPRVGMTREEHPSSTKPYWDAHNALFQANDLHLGKLMNNMAQRVMKQFGSEVLVPKDPSNMEQATLARGNLQQLASAADYAMKTVNLGQDYRALSPIFNQGMVGMEIKEMGPVSPHAHATSPPIYNTGNTHLWGHEMPANLTWKFDKSSGGISFGTTTEPFNVMQRTVHENKVNAVLPSLLDTNVMPKQNDIFALRALDARGLSPIATGDLLKSSDYEPTGVFKTKIIPAYTIHKLDDMEKLRGFSGNWIVQKMPPGKRIFVEKKSNHLKAPGLSKEIKKDLREIKGDYTFDAYLDDGKLTVVDLLVHKGTDLHLEPLEDRINALRTLYESSEHVHFPMPTNCVSTDDEGLSKAIMNFGDEELLIRDSVSTFMKEKEVHPKWIRFAKDSISKQFYPPMPELIVYHDTIKLCYPSIIEPVILKGQFDGSGFTVDSFEGNEIMFEKASRDQPLWGPIAISLLKEGSSSGGAFTSSSSGGYQPLHSSSKKDRPRKLKIDKETILRAPAIIGEDEKGEKVDKIMRQVKTAITNDDTAKTTEQLLDMVDGLNEKMLTQFCGEYGIERTEDKKKWTVNEAIDDDIIERMFPRMNRISPDGGAWAGMQADITAPRGPTELIEDSGTTFYDPKQGEETEEIPMSHLQVKDTNGEEAIVEMGEGKAVLKIPIKTQDEMEDEMQAEPDDRSEGEEI